MISIATAGGCRLALAMYFLKIGVVFYHKTELKKKVNNLAKKIESNVLHLDFPGAASGPHAALGVVPYSLVLEGAEDPQDIKYILYSSFM